MKKNLSIFLVLVFAIGSIHIYDRYNNYIGRYSRTSTGYNYYNKYNQFDGRLNQSYNGYRIYDRYNNYRGYMNYVPGYQKGGAAGLKSGTGYFSR